jgi:hypothetical protein
MQLTLPVYPLPPCSAPPPHPTPRDISKLSLFNVLGVGAVVLLGAAAGLLGLVALSQGTAFAPPAGVSGGQDTNMVGWHAQIQEDSPSHVTQ